MPKVLTAKLNSTDIHRLIGELQAYRDGLDAKSDELSKALAKRASAVAQNSLNGTEYSGYIDIKAKNVKNKQWAVVARNTGYIEREWKNQNGIQHAIVNPLLMAEFGSGRYAVEPLRNWSSLSGKGGRGTFPNQRHAFQSSWSWIELDNSIHHSRGEAPSRPLYRASLCLHGAELRMIARGVFK